MCWLPASRKFDPETGSLMLVVVIVGAFVLKIIGPIGVKFGARKAGELGLNVTEDDLIKTHTVGDVMDTDVPVIAADQPLCDVVQLVSNTTNFFYAVVDKDNRLIGTITLDGIRNTFATQELHDWLVALDVPEPTVAMATPDVSLTDALERAHDLEVEFLPVVARDDPSSYCGMLDTRHVKRRLSAEVLAKQKEADSMHGHAV